MNVGFVGIGAMGLPMARLLLKKHVVVAFDPDADRVSELVEDGATAARNAAEAARGADIVIVMVATPAQLERAVFGGDGIAQGLSAGQILAVMSSVGVEAVKDVEGRLTEHGVRVIDAPVTGGVVRAVTGELTVLVGGSHDDAEAAAPVLSQMSARVVHCGDRVGDGQAVKLVNQLLCSVHLVAAAEALSFARRLGLDPARVLSTIETGAASSFMLSDRGPRMLAEDAPVLSAIDIFVKDSRLVAEAADKVGATTPLVKLAHDMFGAAAERGLGREDDSRVIRLYEEAKNA